MVQKKFQELNLSDAYLFAVALEDPETCRLVLELLLSREIREVTVRAEHFLLFSSDCRNIRLDIYAADAEGTRYNVEMQGDNKGNLPQRSRYHQAEADVLSLQPGEDFRTLRPNYTVFLCCFDPFGKGLYRYTFTNRCAETDLSLEDGTTKVFLNTKGRNPADVPPELVHFLKYVESSTAECAANAGDSAVRRIHDRVAAVKKDRNWERQYMLFEELLQEKHQEGVEEGIQKGHQKGMQEGIQKGMQEGRITGENRMLALINKMTAAGEAEKISMLSDRAFLEEMYCKYGLA